MNKNITFKFNNEVFSLDSFALNYSTKSKIFFNVFLLLIITSITILWFGHYKESSLVFLSSIIFIFLFMQNIINSHIQYELKLIKLPKELLRKVSELLKKNDDEWNAEIIENLIENKKGE